LLADHGYVPSNPPEWIQALQPPLIMLGVASDDRKGLPSAEIEEFLKSYPHLRTDQNGWIKVTTDGEQMWVEVEKK
jgi:beta-lactamase superfamily II metal-dependent hydrolase